MWWVKASLYICRCVEPLCIFQRKLLSAMARKVSSLHMGSQTDHKGPQVLHSPPVPHILPSSLPRPPHKETNQSKQVSKQRQKQTNKKPKTKQNKNHNRKISLLLLFYFSNTSSFVLVAMEASLSHQFYWQMSIAMSRWSGSRPLVSGPPPSLDPNRNSSGRACGCCESWRSSGYCPRWGRC